MNTTTKNLNGLPGPVRRLPNTAAPPAPFRSDRADALEQLKLDLLAHALASAEAPAQNLVLRRAANEAASLAWLTPYPLLVFPALFEEKISAAWRSLAFQEAVRRRSLELAFAA